VLEKSLRKKLWRSANTAQLPLAPARGQRRIDTMARVLCDDGISTV
jgi:hypothetical protein